jgi:hypothetical protein
MQSLENKEKIRMASQVHAEPSANDVGTVSNIDVGLTQPGSRTVLEQTRRDLIVMREAHGADSAIGHRCSNIVELLQMPELPRTLLARQMADLHRLTSTIQ